MIQIFNQKKRNRPIKITDVAVSKVARANLPNFSDEEDIFIQEQHKRLLVISKAMKELLKNCDKIKLSYRSGGK